MAVLVLVALSPVAALFAMVLTWCLLHHRILLERARMRAANAEREAFIRQTRQIEAERLNAEREAARREALDQFLSELRVEERRWESVAHTDGPVVLQERLCFKRLPISGWTAQELPDGGRWTGSPRGVGL